jgi:hypothetical protein
MTRMLSTVITNTIPPNYLRIKAYFNGRAYELDGLPEGYRPDLFEVVTFVDLDDAPINTAAPLTKANVAAKPPTPQSPPSWLGTLAPGTKPPPQAILLPSSLRRSLRRSPRPLSNHERRRLILNSAFSPAPPRIVFSSGGRSSPPTPTFVLPQERPEMPPIEGLASDIQAPWIDGPVPPDFRAVMTRKQRLAIARSGGALTLQ